MLCLLVALPAGITLFGCERPAPPPESAPTTETPSAPPTELTPALLDTSIDLARAYLLTNQREAGNFVYERHFVTGMVLPTDHGVRQAGALWGLSLVHLRRPTERTAAALDRGIGFIRRHTLVAPSGGRYLDYPGGRRGSTGGEALVCLTLVEAVRAAEGARPPQHVERLREDLAAHLRFLVSLRREDGRFASDYALEDGRPGGEPNPYADGEALLAMVKAAKYAGHTALRDMALESARAMWRANVEQALAAHPDSNTTKGFYQWGTMAFYELHTSGWPGTEVYAERILRLAEWMIDVHDVLGRTRNTAYAFEGLAHAYEVARRTGNTAMMETIGGVIEQGLFKLITWQVGSPAANGFIRAGRTHPDARGGILNAADEPIIRIDVVQHQLHAMLLARRFLYE